MKVRTREEAWAEANRLMPTDYELDSHASAQAGYNIFRNKELNPNCWISDLETRLEVNINGKTTNIWIENEPAKVVLPQCDRAQKIWCRKEGYSCRECME